MYYFYFVLILIIEILVCETRPFKYTHSTEQIVERMRRGKEAFEDILKAKKKAEEEYKKKKQQQRKTHYNNKEDDEVESVYVKEIKCYEYVLEQLNNLNMYNCDEVNENNKSLLALARTKCVFVKSVRDFPSDEEGCVLDPKKLTKLQIYLYNNNLYKEFLNPSFLNGLKVEELKKIENTTNPCTALNGINITSLDNDSFSSIRRKDVVSTTEEERGIVDANIPSIEEIENKKKLCENLKYKIVTNCTGKNNMSDVAFQIYHSELNHIDDICFYIQSTEWNKRTEENINRLTDTSMYITRQMTINLENMKMIENAQTRQIENTNKFDLFLKNLKNDFNEVIQILLKIKKHHENFTSFLRSFKLVVMYMVVFIFVLIITTRSHASNCRKKLFACVLLCFVSESLMRKVMTFLIHYIPYINEYFIDYLTRAIRYSYLVLGLKILVATVVTYKEPIRKIEEQLNHIKEIVENTKYIQKNQEVLNDPNEDPLNLTTTYILNSWSYYNEYLDSIYSDDSDFHLSSHSVSDDYSSDTSLVSEQIKLEEIENIPEDSIGKRIKNLHRKKRPTFFHFIPCPNNVAAYTENPATFIKMVESHHEEIMRLREERIGNIEKTKENHEHDENNETLVEENEDQNDTFDFYNDLNKNHTKEKEKEEILKFHSISESVHEE